MLPRMLRLFIAPMWNLNLIEPAVMVGILILFIAPMWNLNIYRFPLRFPILRLFIAPMWNLNISVSANGSSNLQAFYCTYVEFKQPYILQ